MKESRPKAVRTRELQKISEHKFEQIFCLSAGFDAAKIPLDNDYGIDYQVKLIDQQGYVLSDGFVCQLKSRSRLRIKDDTVYVSGFPVKTLNLLRKEAPPSYLFVYVHSNEKIYWNNIVNICNNLNRIAADKWKIQKNVTISIPQKNVLNAEQAQIIYKVTHSVCTEITKARPTLDLVAALKDYAKIDIAQSNAKEEIFVHATQPGLGGRVKLRKEDSEHFRKAVLEGRAISAPVDGGVVELTFKGKKIYELNATDIHVASNRMSDELKLQIPETEHSVGPIKLEVKIWPNKVCGATTKEALPWFFKMELNRESVKSNFSLRFHVEFAKVSDYLQYLIFMRTLGKMKKMDIVCIKDPSKKISLNVDQIPPVKKWQVDFFENLSIIEKHTGLKFHIPEQINQEEIELARTYATLLSKGSIMLPVSAKSTATIKGDDLRKQASTLLSLQGQLIAKLKNEFLICGEHIEFNTEFILEDAALDAASRKLVEAISNLDNEKMYKLEYESTTGKQGRLILKS